MKNVNRSALKAPVIIVRFWWNLDLSTDFWKNIQI